VCGSATDLAGGSYSASSDPLTGFKGPTSKEGEGTKDGREGQGMGEKEGRGPTSKVSGRGGR